MAVESLYKPLQLSYITEIIREAARAGITNPALIAGILSVVAKETGFVLRPETGYQLTDNARIRAIFSKTRSLSDAQLTALKKDPVAFFNFVYGGLFGNGPADGYRYRGRGFNGITFKDNYRLASADTGRDLITNPDLLNDPKIAARALIGYYKRNYPAAVNSRVYPITANINSAPDSLQAYNVAFGITKGKHSASPKDATGGYQKGAKLFPDFYEFVKKKASNPAALGVLGFALLIAGYFYFSKRF